MHFEKALWVLLAFFVILYGNGAHDLVTVVLTDARIWRFFLYLACASLAANASLFAYLYIWIEGIQHSKADKSTLEWVEPAGAATLTAAIVSFIIALWPIFGFMSLLMTVILSTGGVLFFSLLPTFGFLKIDKTPEGCKQEELIDNNND